jgi:hypothetical protein
MPCGHHRDALVWDDDLKKEICSACRAEAASTSYLAKAFAAAKIGSVVSMGCSVPESKEKCVICSGEEQHPLIVKVPLPPPGVPNKNGDVFPEGIGSKISMGAQVRHENKVVGEISRVSDRKVVAHITRELERKLGDPPASEEIEVQTQIVERAPAGSVPGLVSVEINTSGRPVHFVRVTDHGDHARVLHTALKLLEAIDADIRANGDQK